MVSFFDGSSVKVNGIGAGTEGNGSLAILSERSSPAVVKIFDDELFDGEISSEEISDVEISVAAAFGALVGAEESAGIWAAFRLGEVTLIVAGEKGTGS